MNHNEPHPKEWANPTAAGLVALAVACACFFAMLTGRVPPTTLMGCWLIGGFVVQIVVALLDLKGGNHTGGNTFLFFSAFFMLVSGLEIILKANAAAAGSPINGLVDGYAWCVLTLVMFLWTPAFFAKFSMLSVIVILLDIALPFIAMADLGVIDKAYTHISAWALLGAGAAGVYLSAALVVNAAFGRKVYPLP